MLEDVAATKGATFLTPTTGFTKGEILDLVQNWAGCTGRCGATAPSPR